uniref:ABC transporter domain-containing protein n=1 Tax=Parascaris equorum TaxID=6256 RepID=A0A914RFA5_PAREQ
ARNGRTSITIARRPSAVKNIDQIFVFENGHIVEAGTDEELRELNGAYVDLMKEEEANECGGADDDEEETDRKEEMELEELKVALYISFTITGANTSGIKRCMQTVDGGSVDSEHSMYSKSKWNSAHITLENVGRPRGSGIAITNKEKPEMLLFVNSISQPEEKNMPRGARLDAVFFTILGIFAGAFIFVGCFLFGWTGESMTARLRQQLFTRILYQNISSDVPKIRIAIDQNSALFVKKQYDTFNHRASPLQFDEKMRAERKRSEHHLHLDAILLRRQQSRHACHLPLKCIVLTHNRAIALTGPNGCGNCAPIELIERFYDPMDGVINITYGLCNVPQQQVEQVAMIVRLHDFIRLLPEGYESRVDDDRIQIPPLEKHKIAIARAIIRNPRILLIDNSTSTLEPEEEQFIQEQQDMTNTKTFVGLSTIVAIQGRLKTDTINGLSYGSSTAFFMDHWSLALWIIEREMLKALYTFPYAYTTHTTHYTTHFVLNSDTCIPFILRLSHHYFPLIYRKFSEHRASIAVKAEILQCSSNRINN